MKSSTSMRAFVALLVSAAFLWCLALVASPELHAQVHKDANVPGHTCAVTLIASGSYDHPVALPLITVSGPDFEFCAKLELNSVWVQPLFLGAHIYAHAPPHIA